MFQRILNFANKLLVTCKLNYSLKPSCLYTTRSNILTFYFLSTEWVYVLWMDLRSREAIDL